jgi:hypothetical protein
LSDVELNAMVKHLYPDFLKNLDAYALAEQHWIGLWKNLDPLGRDEYGWKQPWFQPLPPDVSEGNPIFSAFSPMLKRGIRILQSEPTEKGVEFYAYPDTFGGTIFDPAAIHELVISCALSDVAVLYAMSLIRPWVSNKLISFDKLGRGVVPQGLRQANWAFDEFLLPSAA